MNKIITGYLLFFLAACCIWKSAAAAEMPAPTRQVPYSSDDVVLRGTVKVNNDPQTFINGFTHRLLAIRESEVIAYIASDELDLDRWIGRDAVIYGKRVKDIPADASLAGRNRLILVKRIEDITLSSSTMTPRKAPILVDVYR